MSEQAEWCNMWCGWGGFCPVATLACAYAAVPIDWERRKRLGI